jgi:hypothetical protein
MIQHLLQHQYDIIAINETNKNWRHISHEQRPWRTLSGVWQSSHMHFNYNTIDMTSDKSQPGGTGIISTGTNAHRIMGQGKDTTGLGRWSWTKYRGKEGLSFVVVSVYRPVVNSSGESPNSTWNQHKRYFSNIGRDVNPREQILTDLARPLREWYRDGTQIAVSMDANEFIGSPTLTAFFRQFELQEAILSLHPTQKAPATRCPGSITIDGMWISRSLQVTKAGYSKICDSYFDHRSGWVDISSSSAFGYNAPPLCAFQMRKLKTEDPTVVKQYNKVLQEQLQIHRIESKLYKLKCTIQEGKDLDATQAKELEVIDKKRIESMIHAESKCRKLKTGAVPWSLEYQDIKNRLSMWECIFRIKVLKAKIGVNELHRRATICYYTGPDLMTVSLQHIKQQRSSIRRELYNFSKTAETTRHTFIEQLALRKAQEGKSTAATQLKVLLNREILRQSYRRIKYATRKFTSKAVTMVETVNDDGTADTITDFLDLNKELQRSAAARLVQSANTPFMQSPLQQHFSTFYDTPHVDQIMAGTYIPPEDTDPYAKIFIKYLKRPPSLPDISSTWTMEQYRISWKRRREKTSSGDASTHMGHFKAGVQVDSIARIHNDVNNIINSTGYSLKRLQRSLDIMIPKKSGSLRADKMRLINLVQPCFNQLTALNSYRFMKHAESHKIFAIEQNGSRKNLSAILHATNKVLMFDYLRITKTKAIICANDAKSCYDRIVLMAAFLCLRRMGLQSAPIRAMFHTIQRMRHYTSSAYGTSTTYYDTLLLMEILNGILQGNCFGPGTWAAVSTPLLDMMRGEGYGTRFYSPLRDDSLHIAGFSFVDDTDVVQTGQALGSRLALLQTTQEALNLWEGGLRTTGGALVPDKSDWTFVDFEAVDGQWKYTDINEEEQLSVKNEFGIRENLDQLHTSTGRLTLGVHISADGNWSDEIKYLTEKSKTWAEHVRTGHIQRHDVWLAFQSTIRKSLDYCLPATYFTKKEVYKIHSAALNRGLSATGIVRTLDRSICYGPLKFQGLGIQDPYVKQGIEHIKMILQHGHVSNIPGKLLTYTIEGTMLEAGLIGNLFDHDFDKYGQLATTSWIKATWKFLWEYNISLKLNPIPSSILRIRDTPLIYEIIERGPWTLYDINCIKTCMHYMDIFSLGDIVTASGTHIRRDCLLGNYLPHSNRTKLAQLPCIEPSSNIISNWVCILQHTFRLSSPTSTLPFQLGHWTSQGLQQWKWFLSPSTNRIYHRQNDEEFEVYVLQLSTTRRSRRHFNKPYRLSSTTLTPPRDLRPASVFSKKDQHTIYLHSTYQQQPVENRHDSQAPNPHMTNILTSLQTFLPQSLRWVLHDNIIPADSGYALARQIYSSAVLCIADGSFKNGYGTAAFILDANNENNSWTGVVPCYGHPSFHDAYRSELTGLLAITSILQVICDRFDLHSGIVHIGCDNDSALARCLDEDWMCNSPTENWDIIQATRHAISSLPISLFPIQVTGHLDKHTKYEDLLRKEQLNVNCDTLAKLWWKQTYDTQTIQQGRLPGECLEIKLQGIAIKQHLEEAIFAHCSQPAIMTTWHQRRHINIQQQQDIDWALIHKAMKRIPHARRLFITKHVANRSATGVQMKRRKERTIDNCPRCDLPNEDNDHILRCLAPSTQNTWTTALQSLETKLSFLQAPRDLSLAIISMLESWRLQRPFICNPLWDNYTVLLINLQSTIGAKLTLEGCIHSSWEGILQEYLSSLQSKINGERFVTALIKLLWQIAWDMWDHRNNILHDNEANATLLGITALNTQIITMYHKGILPLMTPDEKVLFKSPLESLLRLRPPSKRAWIASVKASHSLCLLRHNSFLPREREFMTTFLGRTVSRN